MESPSSDQNGTSYSIKWDCSVCTASVHKKSRHPTAPPDMRGWVFFLRNIGLCNIHSNLTSLSSFMYFIHLIFLGKGPFPGILDLYILGGGLNEQRASLLANKGFVVLALAYYGYQDLPKNPKKLDLEYFEEAANFLQKHPEVSQFILEEMKFKKSIWKYALCTNVSCFAGSRSWHRRNINVP